jgi:opacity protein-like surface antigen
MKKFILIIALAMFTFNSHAQGFLDAGLKAGLSTSKLSIDMDDYTPENVNKYMFGAFARLNFGRFYIQPEAYYNSKGGEFIDEVNASTVNSFNLKAVDVPVLAGFKIFNKEAFNLRINAGPVFSFVTDKSVKGQFTTDNIEDSFFGWQYGAGVDFLFLTFDLRMESFGKSLYDAPKFENNGIFLVCVGFKLF